ncbi:MAG: hypothetical protein FWD61_18045 [Phycisphaerales bacterium]|nr:hypothetical protein [Phycisphaerales bacterium]
MPKSKINKNVPINQILVGDTIKTLHELSPEFADLVFADPPYNIGYKYDQYHDADALF